MSRSVESPASREVAAARAMDDLRFIRTAMEDASGFTSVPGAWLAAVGGFALGTVAYLRWGTDAAPGSPRWIVSWALAAGLSLATGVSCSCAARRPARRARASRPGRKLVLGVGAPLVAGLLASLGAWRAGVPDLLPGLWLASYGAGVLAGGAFSPRPVLALGGVLPRTRRRRVLRAARVRRRLPRRGVRCPPPRVRPRDRAEARWVRPPQRRTVRAPVPRRTRRSASTP